jgi:hypothetical protein
MESGPSEIRVPKWCYYLVMFLLALASTTAVSFMFVLHAAGHEVWGTVLHEATFAAFLTAFMYLVRRR